MSVRETARRIRLWASDLADEQVLDLLVVRLWNEFAGGPRRTPSQQGAGAAVLLISEDLDELLGLADRIVVMSLGRIVYEVDAATADKPAIGKHMAGG